MMMERGLKIFMIGGIAVLCVLVVAGNIHDPGTNLLFVQHVFSMDTITPASAMADHAFSIPVLWQIGFWLIVLGEGLTAILFVLATVELLRARKFTARDFQRAKRFVFAGSRLRVPCLVHRVSRHWRRMVCDVAVTSLEWPASRVSHSRFNSPRFDFRGSTGRRALSDRGCPLCDDTVEKAVKYSL
jgi:predicted small integral membrane protein